MGEIKVSVILPSLNVYKYIRECIESVINQTLRDIEIICVDAGSTDGTLEVLREYEAVDPRVKVIISDKKSYGYQMNLGMDMAKGEFIGIVETDDYISLNMYEDLYKIAREKDLDLIKADFYRFTGQGETLSKAYYTLTWYKGAYNRLVDIRHHQEAFTYTMNTWSGIYKRQFLTENNVRHNETPGASYQDNGFWFQTFMYARRAFFVDKPYYMNRRDNEASSVYSKGKVYCICDEYDFIFQIMEKNRQLIDDYGFSFGFACNQAYKGNFNRISDEYKHEFLIRWSEDFRKLRDYGLLDFRKIGGADWNNLIDIVNNPDQYYSEKVLREELFFKSVRQYSKIIIYGAGMIGKKIWEKLVYCEKPADVISFAVTRKEDNYSSYKGTPIKCIDELLEYRHDGCVVIGTTELYQDDIRKTLTELGFENIIAAPYAQEKDEKYYQNLNYEQREKELRCWYERTTGKRLNLDKTSSLNEKIQYMKLYSSTELMERVADKAELRKYIEQKVGERYLSQIIGIYSKAEDVPFDDLPEEVLIKLTNSDYCLYKRKGELYNWAALSRGININLLRNHAYTASMELWFRKSKGKILIETMNDHKSFYDYYKFICIDGQVIYISVEQHKRSWDTSRRDLFDADWNHLNIRMKYPNAVIMPERPDNLQEMKHVAEELASDFEFAVVHIMNSDEGMKVYDLRFQIGSGVEILFEDGK